MNQYELKNIFIHPNALNECTNIGPKTRIWAFAHILPGAQLGAECNICDHVFIENDVKIGDRVTIKCGVQIWDGIELENDVFVGPNVTFSNDIFPRSKRYPEKFSKTIVRKGASIGANATLLPGLTIGTNAMIGAGAVVTRDVPPNATVVGNPAMIHSYTGNRRNLTKAHIAETKAGASHRETIVNGVFLKKLPQITDLRGSLTFAQIGDGLPFAPKRYFVIYDVPTPEVRGEHAHHKLEQYIVLLKGHCTLALDDGLNVDQIHLSDPTTGVHIQPRVWVNLFGFSKDCVLLVLASDIYKESDYIRDYDEFLTAVKGGSK